MQDQVPASKLPPTGFRLPADVRALLPLVAEKEGKANAHAFGVEVLTNRVRRAARKHGIEAAPATSSAN